MSAAVNREESIFYEAVELTDEVQRRHFLDKACARDPAIRAGVEALLAAHEIATQFFDEGGASLKKSLESAGIRAGAVEKDDSDKPLIEEQLGARIGRYQLLKKIGEGGCGAVYMAEQFEPVRRKVALKIIKLGMDTKKVIARFEVERQALALMDHPNIAQVFDAGATDAGRPYFVMELVKGLKITEYCNQNDLNIRQRLELFVQVCHAIQHAHQKGIIHRDIKPSNTLVTIHDGIPLPKVIDFGIAKATGAHLTDKAFTTVHSHFIGTPAYISPEQAAMGGQDADTRSDIYSLGVLLYELLTGQTPFDGDKLLQSGLDEMRRILREDEPPRPSTFLTTLRGDLDWIVMKTLEKDRRRRYETANGLALDIQRYLNNEPVLARPPNRLYRLQKLVRRNKAVFASGTVVAAALIISLGTATWSFYTEKEALQQAEIREKITQAAFAVSQDRPADADRIINGVANAPPSLESALAYRSVGEWHALNGRWQQASERFATLLQMDQLAGLNVATSDMLECGAALAESGEQSGYEHFREQAVARFAPVTNVLVSERIIEATLLFPASDAFYNKLESFAGPALLQMPARNPSVAPDHVIYLYSEHFAVISACSFDGRSVGLCFDQPVDPASATNRMNYRIPDTEATNVTLAADGESVVLELASGLTGEFRVTVNNVKDETQNQIISEVVASGTVLNLRSRAMGDAANTSNSITYHGNVATIVAGGSDIWHNGDHFMYQYLPVTNDFDYRLRVQAVKDTDGTGFARAGLMARDSLEDIKGHMVIVERNAGPIAANSLGTFQVTFRAFADQPALTIGRPSGSTPLPPADGVNSWIRLRRSGTVFSCYSSTNAVDWEELHQFDGAQEGDRTFTNSVLYLGIATSAHSSITNTLAVVSDLGVRTHEPVRIVAQSSANIDWRPGSSPSLRVVASGFPVLYQWRKNGVNIPGATNANYAVTGVGQADAGAYSVLVHNDISSLVSSDMIVAVKPDTDPPIVNEVVSFDGKSVGVIYNKAVDPVTATNTANYDIGGTSVAGAVLMPDGQTVVLVPQSPVAGNFMVTVSNVRDLSQNTISAGSKISSAVLNLHTAVVGDAASQPSSVIYDGNTASITAGGSDIAEHGDHFVYQYIFVTNDFDYRLRVQSIRDGGGAFARTGLMARDSAINETSRQVMVAVNEGNTFQVMARMLGGSIHVQSQPPNPLPAAFGSNSWVRLQRIGTAFCAYGSDDGVSWTKLYQFDSIADGDEPFANPICLGIATSAWSGTKTATAVVSDLSPAQTMPASMMLSLALLEFRRGRNVEAMDWCHRCISYPDYQTARVATARVIMAMCCQRLNQHDEARSELARARKMIEAQIVGGLAPGNAVQGFWFDWISAHVLLDEAVANIADIKD